MRIIAGYDLNENLAINDTSFSLNNTNIYESSNKRTYLFYLNYSLFMKFLFNKSLYKLIKKNKN